MSYSCVVNCTTIVWFWDRMRSEEMNGKRKGEQANAYGHNRLDRLLMSLAGRDSDFTGEAGVGLALELVEHGSDVLNGAGNGEPGEVLKE